MGFRTDNLEYMPFQYSTEKYAKENNKKKYAYFIATGK